MKKHLFTAISIICFFSSSTYAAKGEIKRIFPYGERVNFQLKDDACNDEYKYYFFDTSSTQGKSTYSLLLSSAVAKQEISVRFEDDDQPCNPNIDKRITYIYVDY